MNKSPLHETALERLREAVGGDRVITDAKRLASLSHDIAGPGKAEPVCVVMPASLEALQQAVAAATGSQLSVVPRGGGMSYSGGYTPSQDGCVLIDTSRLRSVSEINIADRYIVVEAGCNWATLYDALSGTGFRPPSFGPLSGSVSTVGGAVSQNALFFGSATAGSIAGTVIGLEIVLADGRLLQTGVLRSDGVVALPHGPDLTHLFVGDCGAFGVKARIALRLEPTPGGEAFLSVAFDDLDAMLDAQADLAGRPGLGECFTFDRQTHANILERRISFREKIGTVTKMAKKPGGLAKAALLPLDGLGFLENAEYSMHLSIEGDDAKHAAAREKTLLNELVRRGGAELPDAIPRITRARPFGPVTALLGPQGENWLPVHGAVSLSRVRNCVQDLQAMLETRSTEMAKAGVTFTVLTVLAPRFVLVEPQFFWPDQLSPFHMAHVTSEQARLHARAPSNMAARELVHALRKSAVQTMDAHGASHMQIGRFYPYRSRLTEAQTEIFRLLRVAMDPSARMNPGVLDTE